MKKFLIPALFGLALSCGPKTAVNYPVTANPYLPLWEHMPDGEPHVFEDPDNPGKYRIYVTGSHDVRVDSYCGQDDRQWSAPVDNLSAWRDEGPVFMHQENGVWSTMYAPDIVEVNRRDDGTRKYYLFPHCLMRMPMVCVGDRPDGPFTPLNVKDGQVAPGSIVGFDPGVLIENVDDPEDPDYPIGFRAYVAWGIQRSSATELDQNTMYTPRYGKADYDFWIPSQFTLMLSSIPKKDWTPQMKMHRQWANLKDDEVVAYPAVAEGEDQYDFDFFEASSFRKVGNKYVYIYSGFSGEEYGVERGNATLRYAYADTPRGPWKAGGVLVDARGPVLSRDGKTLELSFPGNNTHGSIEYVNGQWYVFYHRAPRGFGNARQAMVAPVYVEADEKPVSEGGKVVITAYDPYKGSVTLKAEDGSEYKGAEVTSEGFNIYGLDPYNYYSAGYACYMSHPESMQDNWDIWDNRMDLTDVRAGDIIGYKYFNFNGLKKGSAFNLFLAPKTDGAFKVEVWLDGPWPEAPWNGIKAGEVEIPAGSSVEIQKYTFELGKDVCFIGGKHAVYLVAGEDAQCDVIGLGFTKKGRTMVFPQVPQVQLFVDGNAVETPAFPVRASDFNGITGYDLYEADVNMPVGTVTAQAPGVDIEVVQATPECPEASVKCTWKGITKTYKIKFNK